MRQDNLIIVGRILGLYGVKGWLRVQAYTSPAQNILKYQPWQISNGQCWELHRLEQGKMHGKGLVIKLAGLDDRDQAATFLQRDIAIDRVQLPPLQGDSYYWTDLEGLRVVTSAGQLLGRLDYLFETGANDVMVVKGDREHLIPWVRGQVVVKVDLDAGFIEVNWDPDF
jgi:16S rRNA processing protein RimM